MDNFSHTWHQTSVVRIEELGGSYIILSLRHGEDFQHKAGQHCLFRLQQDGKEVLFYFSIASRPNKERILDFCIAYHPASRVYGILKNLAVGDQVSIGPALGDFVLSPQLSRPVVMVAGGSGIAPIRAILQDLSTRKVDKNVKLIFGCRSDKAIPFKSDLEQFKRQLAPHFDYVISVEQATGSAYHVGRVTDHMSEVFLPAADYYVCGPAAMVDATQNWLLDRGIDEACIHFERY